MGRLEGALGEEGREGKALLMMEGGRKGRLEKKRKEGRGLIVGSELGINPPADPQTHTFWIKAVHLKGPTLDKLLTTHSGPSPGRRIPMLPL